MVREMNLVCHLPSQWIQHSQGQLKRVSRDQIRVNVGEAAFVLKKLVEALMTWADVLSTFPITSPIIT